MGAIEKINYEQDYIPVFTRKEASRVFTSEILYIEKELRLVKIHTSSRVYRFYGKLDDIVKYLNNHFYICHKSCIVNLDKITRMEDGVFYLEGERTLHIGRNNYQYTRSYYRKFLEQRAK